MTQISKAVAALSLDGPSAIPRPGPGVRREPVARVDKAPLTAPRRIVLAEPHSVAGPALHYALNVCERLLADLDVLTAAGPSDAMQRALMQTAARRGLGCRVYLLDGDFLTMVSRHIAATSGVLFVVTSASGSLAERMAESRSAGPGHPRQLSWVVIEDRATLNEPPHI